MTEKIDFSQFADDVEDTNLLTVISVAADQLKAANSEVERIRGELAAAEHTAKTLAERTIPELMLRAKMESFRTTSGLNVSIGEDIKVSIPKPTKHLALDWMKEKGYGKIIRNEVTAEFPVGQEEAALKLLSEVKKLNTVSHASVEATIAPATFRAWALKRLEEGVELPDNLFTIFRQRLAKLED